MKKLGKKLLAIILAVAMLTSMMISFDLVSAEEALDIWDGTTAEPVAVGDGVYEISTPEQLAYVISTNGGIGNVYNLTADIYLNDITKVNWSTGEVAEGYTVNSWYIKGKNVPFNGILNGNGHMVYGVYYMDADPESMSTDWPSGAGLVPYLGTGTVKNIGTDYSYINNFDYNSTGAIVGSGFATVSGSIENCFAGENVTVTGYIVGGIIGGAATDYKLIIRNCYSLATLIGDRVGGIIGNSWQGDTVTVENCFTLNKATGSDWNWAAMTNVYETVDGCGANFVSDDNLKGEVATETLQGFDFEYIWKTTDSYPVLRVFEEETTNESEFDKVYWNGTIVPPVDKGNGVYEIETAEQLAYVISTGGGKGNIYNITNDLYLNDLTLVNWATGETISGYVPNSWYKLSKNDAFNGVLNGNGHVVYGLYYNDTEDTSITYLGAGLVPAMGMGTVKNIGVETSYIYNYDEYSTAAIVGGGSGGISALIEQCYVGSDVTIKGFQVAGIIGGGTCAENANTIVRNCYSLAILEGDRVGGIVGNSWVGDKWTAINCFTLNKATGSDWNWANLVNVYETIDGCGANFVSEDALKGDTAQTTLAGFDANIWKFTESYPTLRVFDGENTSNFNKVYWNGTIVPPVGVGDNIYEISTAEQLAYVISTNGGVGNTYNITADIYLNDLTKVNWSTGEVADGYTVNPWYLRQKWCAFNGDINGNGHMVYGLYYKDDNITAPDGEWGDGAALVPYLAVGDIYGVGVDYSYINNYNANSTAAIVGGGYGAIDALIEQCYVGSNVTVEGYDVAGIYGGGCTDYSVCILDCYSLATLKAEHFAGGIVATAWSGDRVTVENCYTLGKGTSGDWQNPLFINVYETVDGVSGTLVSEDDLKGKDVTNTLAGFDFENVWVANDSYVVLALFNPQELGDVNYDLDINIIDLVKMKKIVIADDSNDYADLDKDGYVSASDLTIMRKYLLGGISNF